MDLDFPAGVIGVVGRNGSGKSTLLEVFAWMLYGSVGVKTKNVDLFPDFIEAKGVTEGIMQFESAGQAFRIERGFKRPAKSTAMLYADNVLLASGTREVSAEIEKLTGMDWKAFQTSFYTRQNELNLLGSLQPAERSKRLEEMLGLERTNIIINNIKGDLRSLEGEIRGLGQLIEREEEYKKLLEDKKNSDKQISVNIIKLDGEASTSENKVAGLKTQFSETERQREKFQALKSGLALKRQDAGQKQKRADLLARQISEIEAQKDHYESLKAETEKLPEVQKNAEHFEKEQLKFEALKQKRARLESLEKEMDSQISRGQTLGNEIDKLKNKTADTAIIINNIKELDSKIEPLREKVSDLKITKAKANADLGKLRDQLADIENLGPDAVCSFCLRPFEGEMDDIKGHFHAEIVRLENDESESIKELERVHKDLANLLDNKKIMEKKREEAEKIAGMVASAEGERKILREGYKTGRERKTELENEVQEIGEVNFDADLYAQTRKELNDLQKKRAEFSGLSERMGNLEKYIAERNELLEDVAIINDNMKSIEQDLQKLGFSEEEYLKLKNSLEQEFRQLESKKNELYELREKNAGLKAEIKGLENQLENISSARKKSSEISSEKVYLESLIELLKELKTELAQRIRPTLTEYSSRLLERMSDGKFSQLELDKEYEIFIRDYGELCELNRFSGGEQDLANLSLRLAISKLLAQSSHLEAGFLILDEVFGSQDSFRKEMILGAIAGLQDFFRQIFIVTHVDDIKEAVQTLMTVTENPDGSSSVIIE